MTVLMQVLTLFILMLCGLIAMKTKLMNDRDMGMINSFLLNFALVGLVITKMQQDASPELLGDLVWMFVLSCLFMTGGGLLASRLFIREAAARKAVLISLCTISNCAYMGYPVITAAMGADALIYAVVFTVSFNVLSWTVCAYFFGGREAMQPARLLRNPSLIAVVIGLVLFLTGLRLPKFLNDALDALGNTTTPLAMFVIGARLISLRPRHLKDLKLLLACTLRLVLIPLCVLLLHLTPLSSTMVNALYLCIAMPGAAMTAMQAELFNCDKELASRGVALSTALSLVTIPLMLAII
jgi:predicted permease